MNEKPHSDIGEFIICGHVGAAGKLTVKHERSMRTLLILDSLRGTDSTGIAVVSRQGDVKMAKAIGDPFRLFDTKSYDKALQGINSAIIGHNRWATQGKVSTVNAHPFEFDTLVGAHNGTLKNKHVLADHQRFDVDSENLYHHMTKHGVEDTIHKLDGAWALVWFDKEEGTLNFIRNKERPLFMTVTEDSNVLYWASEKWMLSVALSREEIPHKEIMELPIDSWYRFELYDDGSMSKPHITPLATKVVPYVWPGASQQNVYPIQNRSSHQQQHPQHKATIPAITHNAKETAQSSNTKSSILIPSPYKANAEVRMKITGEAVDMAGSTYYICIDSEHQDQVIRLYKNRNDKDTLMGKFICANLHMYRYTDRFGAYHKVEYGSVRLADVPRPSDDTTDNTNTMFQDHHGKLVSKDDWNTKHGVCGWCTGHVDPEKQHRFTTSGDVLCELCCDDKEVHKYVNLV